MPGEQNYKYIDFPNSNYASASFDRIVMGGKTVGFSMFAGYSYNERTCCRSASSTRSIELGDVLTLVWGEENGGTHKTTVEPHRQLEVRVQVATDPVRARRARELSPGVAHAPGLRRADPNGGARARAGPRRAIATAALRPARAAPWAPCGRSSR